MTENLKQSVDCELIVSCLWELYNLWHFVTVSILEESYGDISDLCAVVSCDHFLYFKIELL